ncbi:RNA 2',3'-cyclic phosphodiesterase [Candidatus Roizmanbacteria bacterium]|nr:RNA 2',3'-cyclic phosphodiesterase [Candidatus Roizmanbacteria bacterium]
MRLFLAVDPPSATKKKLDEQLEKLKKEYAFFNWVPRENFHITLQFFGERSDTDKVKRKIEEAIYDVHELHLYSFGADLFLSHKILLFISFRREKILEEIVYKIRSSFSLQDRTKYAPHLTIARARVPSKQQYLNLKKKLFQLPIQIDFAIRKIHLYQSILNGKKPIYKKIAPFDLIKRNQS